MRKPLNRREFIKLLGLLPLGVFSSNLDSVKPQQNTKDPAKNIIILVLDALSAKHLSTNGYSRQTMPNLERLATKAIVFHNHYAGGNYTVPGTASLLTGVLPWTHRALKHNDTVKKEFINKNIFHAFQDYYSNAYSQNGWVNTLLKQLKDNIDLLIPQEKLFLAHDEIPNYLFDADIDIASLGWNRAFKQKEAGHSYSLYLSQVYEKIRSTTVKNVLDDFPRGIPNTNTDNYFLLNDAVEYLVELQKTLLEPFLSYYHFLPPHDPYNTHTDFFGSFRDDGYVPIKKNKHPFSKDRSEEQLLKLRTYYDEFILYADHEFGNFYDRLEQSGVLDNTILVLTSDHGELFERGYWGHITPVLHQPVVKIPLVIFNPGQDERIDIVENTSAIDVLPTLLHLNSKSIPDWVEGEVLPPFMPSQNNGERGIFAFQSRYSEKDEPYREGTVMCVQGEFKLIYYFGYDKLQPENEYIELYNIHKDPEELENLYLSHKLIAEELLEKVELKLAETDQVSN